MRLLFILPLLMSCITGGAATEWTATTWAGEAAWTARDGGLVATVSERWGRLVDVRPVDEGQAVVALADPGTESMIGAHSAWLGPQELWGWPPPGDWERHPPVAVQSRKGAELIVIHSRKDGDWPRLRRRYGWVGGALRCTVEWTAGDIPLHALQVLRVRADHIAVTDVSGRVVVRTDDGPPRPLADEVLPGITRHDECLLLRRAEQKRKVFMPRQPLRIAAGGGRTLSFTWIGDGGLAVGQPDDGLPTQVYLPAVGSDWIEIEQASDLLLNASDGTAWSTVEIRLEPPSAVPHRGVVP